MMGILDWLKAGAGAVVGGTAVFGALAVYDVAVDDPAVRKETRLVVEAEAEERTKEAINAVTDQAERARAMLRYCAQRGELYDFETRECRE